MEYPSRLVQRAVEEMARMPGIGQKTALRLVLHLLKGGKERTTALVDALTQLRDGIVFCKRCHNISDELECSLCLSPRRGNGLLCVVEDARDVLAIEATAQYTGRYHVLGGILSPVNGIGPSQLQIESLIERVYCGQEQFQEVILALSPTIEGDTTALYVGKRLRDLPVRVTTIARGIPIGGNLEFADEITLGRSIAARIALS